MIALNDITIRFGGVALFENITFKLNDKDRVGLAGRNGAGKSTLLKIIAGQLEYDEGQIAISSDTTIGYLPQHLKVENTHSVIDETLKAFDQINNIEAEIERINNEIANRTDYESDEYLKLIQVVTEKTEHYHLLGGDKRAGLAEQTLRGLGFSKSDFDRPTSEFSGGWRMRIELAKIILQKPKLLLLDEPTNHLDIESIEWLEQLLVNYSGSVILVSHDRAFLDAVTNRTIEISMGGIYDYPVAYTKYTQLIKERIRQQEAAYENQQRKIKKTEEFIEKFRYKATKSVQVQSRIKMLDKLERIEIDEVDKAVMNIKFPPAPRSGNIVIRAVDIAKYFDDYKVFDNANFTIEKGEKIAFVGQNGQGKTTLVKILLGLLDHQGELTIGHNVKVGYYAQNQPESLNVNKTVFQTIDDIAVGDIRTKTRDILGSFLFSNDDIQKKVGVLSGGEKARLSLACMLLEPINLLVLDEPTHHLDMLSKDILKQALVNYDGTLIIISHDRYFLDSLTNRTFEFRNHKVIEHIGGIDEFIRKRRLERLNELNVKKSVEKINKQEVLANKSKNNREQYEARKELDKQIRKVEKLFKDAENKISELENRISEFTNILSNPTNHDVGEVSKQLGECQSELDEKLQQWEKIGDQIDELNKKRELLI